MGLFHRYGKHTGLYTTLGTPWAIYHPVYTLRYTPFVGSPSPVPRCSTLDCR